MLKMAIGAQRGVPGSHHVGCPRLGSPYGPDRHLGRTAAIVNHAGEIGVKADVLADPDEEATPTADTLEPRGNYRRACS